MLQPITKKMKRLLLIGVLSIILLPELMAWDLPYSVGGRTTSLGRCSVALTDFWSCHNNPAGFATYKDIGIGISYENRFLLKELGYKNAGVLLPIKSGVFGLSISQFGYQHYNENFFGIGFSRSFGPNLRIGLKLDYIFIKFSESYEEVSTATFEIGLQYNINEKICLGTYLFNPIHIKIRSPNNNKIPIIMKFGLSYKITDDVLLTSEVEENFENNLSYRFGLEYEIYHNIFIRSGFQLRPELFTFGLGYEYKNCIIDICGQMHYKLGASLNCSFIFKIKKNNEL